MKLIDLKRVGSLIAITFVFALGVLAQSNSGSITGLVTDQNGAVVANATVTVINQGTNEKRTVQTGAEGRYEVVALPTGVYTVQATANGFQSASVKDMGLAVGEKARIDVALGVSGVNASVTVAAQTKVDTETATVGDSIDSARIQLNPVNGRDFTALLATVPGSVQSANPFQTSINGIASTFGGASVLVDGIDAGRVDTNGTSNVLGRIESRVNRVSMDSISEVQVLEQSYSAQYGQALSAVINPITKSGTNDLHGGAFEYFRNRRMDKPDFFEIKNKLRQSNFNMHQFGGNVSGPIKKDKVFFFTNYEGVRQIRGKVFRTLVPTAAFRAAMNVNIRPVMATMPLPNEAFGTNTQLGIYNGQVDGTLREDTGSVKMDYLQSEKSQFSFRYNLNDSLTTTPYGVGSDQIANGKLRVQLFKASHTYTFSPSMVNEFAFGINHNYSMPDAGSSTLPRFDISFVDQAISMPGPAMFNQIRTGRVYHFLDTVSWVKGNHSIKFGGEVRLNRRDAEAKTQESLIFFGVNDFRDNVPFVIQKMGHPQLTFANENYSGFFQDDWKVHRRLSLSIGLRYDVSSVSREKDGNLQNFDLVTRTMSPKGAKIHEADKNNFGPRFGFAWDVFGTQKTVIRGGYGIFYNRELPASYGSPHVNTYPTISTDLFTALFFCGATTWGYPTNAGQYVCSVPSAFHIEKKLETALAQQWSFNVQQDLGFGTVQVGYVGNHAQHLLTDGVVTPRNINRADPVTNVRPFSSSYGDIFVVGGYPESNYSSLQATLKRTFTNGFRYNVNYTWGHAIDNVVGFFKDYQNENDARAERGNADADIRHNMAFDFGWELPFKTGPAWLMKGWQINSITQMRTGFPVNVTRSGGTFGGFSFRPNLVPGQSTRCTNYSVPDCQFNAAAFSNPGAGVYGNAGRNILRGPGFAQVDLSILKQSRINEKATLQLRLEIFNLFNRANFADPSGGLVNGDANSLAGTAFFGQSTSTVGNQLGGLLGPGGPRQLQISARVNF